MSRMCLPRPADQLQDGANLLELVSRGLVRVDFLVFTECPIRPARRTFVRSLSLPHPRTARDRNPAGSSGRRHRDAQRTGRDRTREGGARGNPTNFAGTISGCHLFSRTMRSTNLAAGRGITVEAFKIQFSIIAEPCSRHRTTAQTDNPPDGLPMIEVPRGILRDLPRQ
jgi:hypothetical protein